VFRVQTYGIALNDTSRSYVEHMLALPALQAWYAQAVAETWRDAPHEADMLRVGRVLMDIRATG